MRVYRLLLALTVLNLLLLVFLLAQMRPAIAQEIAPVLRGRALEIVDEKGTVRADIKIDHNPEVVILHMSDPNGLIRVKLDASSDGSGFMLANNSQQPGIHMLAKGTG